MGDPFAPGGQGNSQSPNPPSAPTPGADAQEVGYQQINRSDKSKKRNNETNTRHRPYLNEVNFFNIFKNYERFFTIRATDGTPLTTIDTIAAYEDLKKHIRGEPKKIVERRDGNITVSVSTEEQSNQMKSLKKLANMDVTCCSDSRMNQSQGTIRYDNYPGFTEEKIKGALARYNVTDIYQLTKRNPDKSISKIPVFILTFNTTQLPTSVTVGWTKCPVRLYIPKPRRCFKCQRFGHSSTNCRSREEVCACCSLVTHEGLCTATIKCSNCGGDHPSYSRSCPTYLKEQEVIAYKVKNHVSFPEARQEVNKRYVSSNTTYSSVTASQTNNSKVQTTNSKPSVQQIFYQTNYNKEQPSTSTIDTEPKSLPRNINNNHPSRTTQETVSTSAAGEGYRSREQTKQTKKTSDPITNKSTNRVKSSKRILETPESPGERLSKSSKQSDKRGPISFKITQKLPNQGSGKQTKP